MLARNNSYCGVQRKRPTRLHGVLYLSTSAGLAVFLTMPPLTMRNVRFLSCLASSFAMLLTVYPVNHSVSSHSGASQPTTSR
jgi:hypothetical protein